MTRSLTFISAFFIFTMGININAQETSNEQSAAVGSPEDGNRRRALVLDIDTRVLESHHHEDDQVVVWSENHRRIAIPGSPVGIKLVGSNVVVAVQFTPFIRRQNQNVLVAQGQIWIDDPEKGISYYTSIQAIPMDFGEPIFFFPLGQARQLDSFIEIMITANLYSESIINTSENE